MMDDSQTALRFKWLYAFIGLAVLVNFSGLWVTIIGPDGALYASIAKTMAINNNFSDLYVEGKDWLDKPHFPFWLAAISFKIFGISTWAYKLPAVLMVMVGAVYTYLFAKSLYNKETGLWAVLILLTAEHLIISNTDVRAEPYLTGLIIASVYHFYKALGHKWFWPLVFGSVFASCAVMTKGIFALIPVFGAIAGHLIITKQWSLLFNYRWLIAAALVLLFMLPELWSLYQQFDAHPEKVIFGRTGVSGLQFFFWDSQFGRFFNTGPIKKASGDPFFFLHTTLWAFLPWCILFYVAVVKFVRQHFRKPQAAHWYNLGGAALTFIIFSASKFQLPHYITIIFPFFAILTAQYIYTLQRAGSSKAIQVTQLLIICLMMVAIGALNFYFQPEGVSLSTIVLLILAVVLIVITTLSRHQGSYKIYFQSAAVVLFVNLYFNLVYYPQLTTYQADSEAAFYLNTHNPEKLPVVKVINGYSYAIDFYSHEPLIYYRIGQDNELPERPFLLFGESEAISQLAATGLHGAVVKTFKRYPITRVKGAFLHHQTREQTLGSSQLILIK
ncbi:4-amino-4-deoxy-L-arabinose transferase-like glycosyltransferase [Pedobacter sp. CAN_A7]|uniref:ArnT family glycosyltransferase n=1 Tax=Pedobacter sp. CAN_A7 TaxID=2787722 RepID=UPI001A2F2C8C